MSFLAPAFSPEPLGVRDRVNLTLLPPLLLIAHGVEGTVVAGTEGYGPLVAHLATYGPRLGLAHMMGMARQAPADQAGLGGHKAQVVLVADPARGADRQGGLVDLTCAFRRKAATDSDPKRPLITI